MKTNNIPALITLSAGAVYCIIGLTSKTDSLTFAKMLLIVLIIFYVLGIIVKIILDKSFKDFDDIKEPEEETQEEPIEREDISTDGVEEDASEE